MPSLSSMLCSWWRFVAIQLLYKNVLQLHYTLANYCMQWQTWSGWSHYVLTMHVYSLSKVSQLLFLKAPVYTKMYHLIHKFCDYTSAKSLFDTCNQDHANLNILLERSGEGVYFRFGLHKIEDYAYAHCSNMNFELQTPDSWTGLWTECWVNFWNDAEWLRITICA